MGIVISGILQENLQFGILATSISEIPTLIARELRQLVTTKPLTFYSSQVCSTVPLLFSCTILPPTYLAEGGLHFHLSIIIQQAND